MKKQKKQILLLVMISVFMATALFLPGLTEAAKNPGIMTMLNESYDMVLEGGKP